MMKKGRKLLVALTLAMLLIATTVLVACGDTTEPTGDTYAITVNKATLSLAVGAEYQLTAQVKKNDETVSDAAITWKSADAAKATVTSSGLVSAVAVGTTKITASFEGGGGLNFQLSVHSL